jgi:hypothetical protein
MPFAQVVHGKRARHKGDGSTVAIVREIWNHVSPSRGTERFAILQETGVRIRAFHANVYALAYGSMGACE